jgi:hypothetical protein
MMSYKEVVITLLLTRGTTSLGIGESGGWRISSSRSGSTDVVFFPPSVIVTEEGNDDKHSCMPVSSGKDDINRRGDIGLGGEASPMLVGKMGVKGVGEIGMRWGDEGGGWTGGEDGRSGEDDGRGDAGIAVGSLIEGGGVL